MNDRTDLRERARRAIRAGTLPNRLDSRIWGGAGTGARCALCGEHVSPDEVELELELADGEPGTLHLHQRCFTAWDAELRTLEAVSKTE